MSTIFKISTMVISLFISSAVNAELVIIGHANYKGGELDADSVRRIFLGKRQSFPDGLKANPVNHVVGSPDRKEFFDTVLAMGESNHKRHWTRMLSTGKGSTPTELSSHKEVLNWVAENPNSIAYIDSRMVNDSVKILLTIEDFSSLMETEDLTEAENLSGTENI